MLEKIQEMLAEELNLPVSKVVADAKIVEDLGADSLDVVELLSRLEDEFGITIPDEDVENLVTVRDVATELEKPWKPLIALGIYGGVSVLLSLLTHKFPKTRKYINGTPTILMNNKRLYRKNLQKAKLDLSEFMLLCREQGYFDLDEIQTAIFEHNGKLSILPQAASRPATPEDLKITAKATHIGIEVIMDGRIMNENLTRIERDGVWLKKRLCSLGYTSAEEIFLGIYRTQDDKLTLYPNEP